MNAYDCLFRKELKVDDIGQLIATLMEVEKQEVAQILENSDCNIHYECSILNNDAEFSWVLSLYVNDEEKIKTKKLFNELLYGIRLSRYLDVEVLINAHCQDPYLWILVEHEKIYLVDEEDNNNDGVNLRKNIKKNYLQLKY